jgi:UDP-4-amino-4,6-dideoxy-N-acetyl-beta-L-altrosamine N-acetyltransferase
MIRGEHIILRAIERDDLKNYVQWFGDPRVLEYFGRFLPMSLIQEEQWYENMLRDSSVCNWAVEYKELHIGGAGFSDINQVHQSAEVGLFIGKPEFWDRGLGRDVLESLLTFGFEQMNLHRIYLRVFAENERAVHLYEKVGFHHEGRWRQAEFRHGRFHDILWMSILRDEWRS